MSLSNWARLLGCLAAEITLLILAAAALENYFHSPRARRILWQAALVSVVLVLGLELSGLRGLFPTPQAKLRHRYVVSTTVSAPSPTQAVQGEGAAAVPPSAENRPNVVVWPGYVWLVGFGLLLTRMLVARVSLAFCRRAALDADEISRRLIEGLKSSLNLPRVHPQVWPGLRSPVAFGTIRPTIALPPDFSTRFSCAEQRAIAAHELAHLAARDPFWLMATDIIRACAWWHPLVWWAQQKLRTASEAAADEASTLVPDGPSTLAECLVRLGRELAGPGPSRHLGIVGAASESQLASRIKRLLRQPQPWKASSIWARWIPYFSALSIALICVLLPIPTGLYGSILAAVATPPPAPVQNLPATNSPAPPAATVVPQVGANATFTVTAVGTAPLSYQWVLNGAPVLGPSKVKLLVQMAVMKEGDSAGLGLDWLFGQTAPDNPEIQTSHDWKALEAEFGTKGDLTNVVPRSTNDHPKNVIVDMLRSHGQWAVLQSNQFAALRERIKAVAGDGFVSAPASVCNSGLQTHLSVEDLATYVTGVETKDVSSTNGASINYFTDSLCTGWSVDIISKNEDDDQWRLQVTASMLVFLGYDDEGKVAIEAMTGGVPIRGVLPMPHFRLVEGDAESLVPLGQTVAIRGPRWTESTTAKAHFWQAARTVNTRKRLYIFVTAAAPD